MTNIPLKCFLFCILYLSGVILMSWLLLRMWMARVFIILIFEFVINFYFYTASHEGPSNQNITLVTVTASINLTFYLCFQQSFILLLMCVSSQLFYRVNQFGIWLSTIFVGLIISLHGCLHCVHRNPPTKLLYLDDILAEEEI